MIHRDMTFADRVIAGFDQALRTVSGVDAGSGRESPATGIDEPDLSAPDRRHGAGLMRVNHAGEVAAQALYHGQASTARRPEVRHMMEVAAAEEGDHLRWCRERLKELQGRPSLLDPIWYGGSFLFGALAGLAGDRWSLGFLAETERQVERHLGDHLAQLPEADERSRAVLRVMRDDERQHATAAQQAGATALPWPLPSVMAWASKLMTRGAYWV